MGNAGFICEKNIGLSFLLKNDIMLVRILLFLMLFFTGCLVIDNPYEGMAPGPWRAELALTPKKKAAVPYDPKRPDDQIERQMADIEDGTLPFVFEVIQEADGSKYIDIINGTERIRVNDITIGTNRATSRDTFIIDFPSKEKLMKKLSMVPGL